MARGRGAGADAGESLEDRMFNANKRDWINCIKSRNQPFCDLDMGHRTAIICNLGNMSLRLGGRTIHWDPEKEVVVGDKEAAAMCTKQYRAPWDGILPQHHQSLKIKREPGSPGADVRDMRTNASAAALPPSRPRKFSITSWCWR